jgi:uncharacterized protein YhfF
MIVFGPGKIVLMDIENLNKWRFELNESASNYLLNLVLEGKKKATSSSLKSFELGLEAMPKEGSLSVITDWRNKPRCIVKTKRVLILPYKEMTFELARLEGEDEDLSSWRTSHEHYFKTEGEELGYVFSPEMKIVFEEFELVEAINEAEEKA